MLKHIKIHKSLLFFALIMAFWVMTLSKTLFKVGLPYQALVSLSAVLLFYLTFNWLAKTLNKIMARINNSLDNISIEVLLGGGAGLLAGIVVGVLTSFPLQAFKGMGVYLTIIIFILSAYFGLKIGSRRAYDLFHLLPTQQVDPVSPSLVEEYKVLDTSAIIDGRIYDVCLTKFIDGKLIVPTFVIDELQHIADSSDTIRRSKGRRGLDLLSKMQKHSDINIDIIDINIDDEKEVDNKLIRLCKKMQASIITNDYNLNKVAELQGINVLNINELTNAVKVIVYPGETMHISIIKEGKEDGQGVGYLEDGTMVVVENAYGDIGNDLDVIVTSVFQTAAGRMIFTRKTKDDHMTELENELPNLDEVKLYG